MTLIFIKYEWQPEMIRNYSKSCGTPITFLKNSDIVFFIFIFFYFLCLATKSFPNTNFNIIFKMGRTLILHFYMSTWYINSKIQEKRKRKKDYNQVLVGSVAIIGINTFLLLITMHDVFCSSMNNWTVKINKNFVE